MRVHHLNCGTMCPYPAVLVNGRGGLGAGRMVCHCLLVETAGGLVLVDTGVGLADCANPALLGKAFQVFTNARFDAEESAARQVARLGFSTGDVRDIVVTHLDLDHAGGIPDFPNARVHVYAPEHAAALHPPTRMERERYRPHHFADARWVTHATDGERWHGFDAVRPLPGGGDEILLVPVVGHTRGHCAVAVKTPGRWLLHCGDAYFFHGEIDPERPRCPGGLALFQKIVQIDGAQRLGNQARLRELQRDRASEIDLFCAHDPVEYERFPASV